jgi:protein dithiol oxidoreductase (disulfide-forming)
MRINRPLLSLATCLLGLALLANSAPLSAQVAGQDFRILNPPRPTQNPAKIEVLEFFSYGCPHCFEFYPLVSGWAAGLPKDVVFRRVPLGLGRPQWQNLQRAYFALQASGDFTRLDGPLFQAIHEEHLPLFDVGTLTEWVGKNGGHTDAFANAYTSFGVSNLTVEADKMMQDYEVDSVPTLAVDGRYVAMGSTFTEIIANTDKLIARVRAERAAAAPPLKHK